jgi:hypothetical protein
MGYSVGPITFLNAASFHFDSDNTNLFVVEVLILPFVLCIPAVKTTKSGIKKFNGPNTGYK